MPQHEMPFNSDAAIDCFYDLPKFTQGYIEAMFFTEAHADNPELEHSTFDDLAPETLETIIADCKDFEETNERALSIADRRYAFTDERAGTDFWFTRNGHGAGFWDRGLGKVGDYLTAQSKPFGEITLYKGDDNKLYLA